MPDARTVPKAAANAGKLRGLKARPAKRGAGRKRSSEPAATINTHVSAEAVAREEKVLLALQAMNVRATGSYIAYLQGEGA